jgi:hypothetical protein
VYLCCPSNNARAYSAAFPTAVLFYRAVFQLQAFSANGILCMFIVLAIGADDVFVFM